MRPSTLTAPARGIGKLTYILRSQGVRGLAAALRRRRHPVAEQARCTATCQRLLSGRSGLEIGGPSPIVFARGGVLPLYPVLGRLDGCNFSSTTLWEGRITPGATFRYDEAHAPGIQFIAEATELSGIPSAAYELVLSSHTLEHTANPLRALREWKRVLREGGILVLVVPHRDGTFDHRRPLTTFEHLLGDLEAGTDEADLTHLPEILALHDFGLDPGAGDPAAFRRRAESNLEHRSLHHHVFDSLLLARAVDHVGLEILTLEQVHPYHIVLVARRPPGGSQARNAPWLDPGAACYRRSLFISDRRAG